MNSLPLIIIGLAVLALAYRFYYGFIAAKVLTLNDIQSTPSYRLRDNHNFVPTHKWVLFGHHFAAIAGAGPLVGPVLATQFGYFPGFAWIILGAVLAGAVHDIVILTASTRFDARSLAEITTKEIGVRSGFVVSVAIFIIIIIALAGLGLVVVNALAESAWGTFTIAATIPIAIVMGLWMFFAKKHSITTATVFGVFMLTLAVILGKHVPESAFGSYFLYDKKTLTLLLAGYGFLASVLPVWLLLTPRDYLSSIMKLGVVALLGLGIIIVAPDLKMPAFTQFVEGNGPIISGNLYPYLFITIACGAISGFHSLVSSGTTPKMLMKESHIKPIAAGAMLSEAFVSLLALIAAASLYPLDYFIINVTPEKLQQILPTLQAMGFTHSEINELSREVGENLAGRTGGAVSLAVGMAQIFSSIPGMKSLMQYWYHFAIMFEALFILTTIDAGTRIARFITQDMLGHLYKPLSQPKNVFSNVLVSAFVVFCWGYFIYTGTVSSIWPMFGSANQMLAAIALIVGTSYLINSGKAKYAWVTLIPMTFVAITTLTSGILNLKNLFFPLIFNQTNIGQGIVNSLLTIIIMFAVVVLLIDAVPKWYKVYKKMV
ncbi:MAG: carbon starvation protein A [Bacteroidales bacterium]|nr:carbon starvation protein A [Bacteroidales bacterium]